MADPRIAFLRARLDEADAARIKALGFRRFPRYHGMPPEWLVYASAEPSAAEVIQFGERAGRDIDAKRAIVDACERALQLIPDGHRANFAGGVLGALCRIWAAHPEYEPGWAVDPLPFDPAGLQRS